MVYSVKPDITTYIMFNGLIIMTTADKTITIILSIIITQIVGPDLDLRGVVCLVCQNPSSYTFLSMYYSSIVIINRYKLIKHIRFRSKKSNTVECRV